MIRKFCHRCGTRYEKGPSRSPTCYPNSSGWSRHRDRGAQARFRKLVLECYGDRCPYVEGGRHCTATDNLVAHHLVPLGEANAYEPEDGKARCKRHHHVVDRYAA
jgi:hypothetical protein